MARWWTRILGLFVAAWVLVLAARCRLPRQATAPSPDSTSAIYVVRHGWHAGIAVRWEDVPEGAWPEFSGGPDPRQAGAQYLEIGWGEARYYPGQARGPWGMARAGLWPTGSVLHVVPVQGAIADRFPGQTVVRVPVSSAELGALVRQVAASFDTTDSGAAVPVADGYYPNSEFYRSGLPYHALNNCNHWAAAALEAAGCDTAPRWTFTVGQLVEQARRCGTLVQHQGDVDRFPAEQRAAPPQSDPSENRSR